MSSRALRLLSRLMLFVLLAAALPAAPLLAAAPRLYASDVSSTDPTLLPPSTPAPIVTQPIPNPPPPGLALDLVIAPDPLAVGDTATITVTVTNRAVYPADHLVVTAPTPDGALAVAGPVTLNPVQGWRWDIAHLDGNASIAVTGQLRLVRSPAGDALVATAQATADGVSIPAQAMGGALTIDRTLGPATTAFTPGSAATLHSSDGRVSVQLPGRASARALTLRHGRTPPTDGRIPPGMINGHPGLGSFFLDATDDQGAAVHQFAAPLTISVSYTPEQIQARGLMETTLTLFYYDDTQAQWVALPTDINFKDHLVTATVDHFTPFQLSDGTSASTAYLPSLQSFQTNLFTGAASYQIPIEAPAGPGGLKPSVALSYSSGSGDGLGGMRPKWQAPLVGRGWSLDAEGYVGRNKSLATEDWDSFTFVFGGRSLDVVRGSLTGIATNGHACTDYLNDQPYVECWRWHSIDESFTRIRASWDGSGYIWQAWTPDGVRYDFRQRLYSQPEPDQRTLYRVYKWLLTSVTEQPTQANHAA